MTKQLGIRFQVDECRIFLDSLLKKTGERHKWHQVDMARVKRSQILMLGRFCPPQILPYDEKLGINLTMLGQILKDKEPTHRLNDPKTVSDYIEIDINGSNHYLIAMVARSGSGKTATVVGLAKKHFVIYGLCSTPGSVSLDLKDTNFEILVADIERMPTIVRQDFDCQSAESRLHYDDALKRKIMDRVKVEFLARMIFLLSLLRKDPELKPEIFFREQMNGGLAIIGGLVVELKKYEPETIQTMQEVVDEMLKEALNGRGLVIALDEAHVAEMVLRGQLISTTAISAVESHSISEDDIFSNKGGIVDEYCRGVLTPLIAALDMLTATIIVLGTAFSLLNAEHVYSASSKPKDRHIRITNFPSANEEDVAEMLSSILDMSDCVIPPEKKKRFVGRYRFTTYILKAIANVPPLEAKTKSKQQILDKAIRVAENKALKDARTDVEKLLRGNNKDIYMHMLCRLLVAFKLKNGDISFPHKGFIDLVNMSLCGLLEGDEEEEYSFRLDEPLVAEAVEGILKSRNVNPEFFVHMKELASIITSYGISTSIRGHIFEQLFGGFLKHFNDTPIAQLPFVHGIKDLPAWCQTVKFRVDSFTSACNVKDDLDYLRNPPDFEGRYPHQLTRPDFMKRLQKGRDDKRELLALRALREKEIFKKVKYLYQLSDNDKILLEKLEYWISFGSKIHGLPVDIDTNESNLKSTDMRLCFNDHNGVRYKTTQKYRDIFERYDYPKIGGILRIHFVFPSVEGGTPVSCVNKQDVIVYIDKNNMDTFFDEKIAHCAKEARIMKRMIGYLIRSKEELDKLKGYGCGCTVGCKDNRCPCKRNKKICTEWCHISESCKNC